MAPAGSVGLAPELTRRVRAVAGLVAVEAAFVLLADRLLVPIGKRFAVGRRLALPDMDLVSETRVRGVSVGVALQVSTALTWYHDGARHGIAFRRQKACSRVVHRDGTFAACCTVRMDADT